jgi:hypothetical protein
MAASTPERSVIPANGLPKIQKPPTEEDIHGLMVTEISGIPRIWHGVKECLKQDAVKR